MWFYNSKSVLLPFCGIFLSFVLVSFLPFTYSIKVKDKCAGDTYMADYCKRQNAYIKCFECDTQLHPECNDPFFEPKPPITKLRPSIRECRGCCLTITHNAPNSRYSWTKRSCSDNFDLKYNFTGQCVTLEYQRSMCFCSSSECNGFNQTESTCGVQSLSENVAFNSCIILSVFYFVSFIIYTHNL